jgi:hypothetical protein
MEVEIRIHGEESGAGVIKGRSKREQCSGIGRWVEDNIKEDKKTKTTRRGRG